MFETTRYVFQTWWDGNDTWDGNSHYEDLLSAKIGAELDYKEVEYYTPGSYWDDIFNPEGVELDEPEFSWKEIGNQLWHLYDGEDATGVAIQICSVYRIKESS